MEDTTGRCHICEGLKPIRYCNVCKHWFCSKCRNFWWPQTLTRRGLAAFEEIILRHKRPGCCGEI